MEKRWSVASRIFILGLVWPIGELIRLVAGNVVEYVLAFVIPDQGDIGPFFEWTTAYFQVIPGLVLAVG
jgi:hypothetical protein